MSEWIRSAICRSSFAGFAASLGDGDIDTIKGVAIVTEGEAKGHNVHLDKAFLTDVATLGNAKKLGVKARFGHPSMSSDAVGTFAGRMHNFQMSGDKTTADFTLADSAAKSPNGNLKEYILSLAEDDPDMFGISIVFTDKGKFQIDNDGEKNRNVDTFDSKQKTFVEIKNLLAADVVDEPAANTGLFSQWSSEMIAGKVAEFLDMNPNIYDLVEKNPQIIEPFIIRYNEQKKHREDKEMDLEKVEGAVNLSGLEKIEKVEETDTDTARTQFAELKKQFGTDVAVIALEKDWSIDEARTYAQVLATDRNQLLTEICAKLEKENKELRALNTGIDPLASEDIDELNASDAIEGDRMKRFETKLPKNLARFAAGLKLVV